jgi:NADPH2:quinone reductase
MMDLRNQTEQSGQHVPTMMQAYVVRQAGGPEALRRESVAVPEDRPGWSLIRVRAFGINHSEIFTRKGLSPSVHFPRILGIDCAGEIARTTDPDRLPVRQPVISIMGEMGRAFDGSYAQYVLVPNKQIYTVNEGEGHQSDLNWTQLAALSETYYTAFGSLLNLRLGQNSWDSPSQSDSVLVRSASSGVGIAFAHLVRAAWPSLRLVGTTRNPVKRESLLAAGYSDVLPDKNGTLETEETFTRALELIGPATIKDTIRHLRPGAIVCSTGQLGGQWYLSDFDPIVDLPANGYLTSFYSGNVSQQKIDQLLDFVRRHHVNVMPDRVLGFGDVPTAHQMLESGHNVGKIVIRV